MEFKGRPVLVTIGYGSPRAVRGLHSSGLERVVVNNVQQLLAVDPHTQGAIIASGVGNRKKQELCLIAVQKKIRILNVRDPTALVKSITEEFEIRKKQRGTKTEEKTKKLQEKEKKAEEKKKKDEKKEDHHNKEEHTHAKEEKHEHEEAKEIEKEMAEKTIIKKQ